MKQVKRKEKGFTIVELLVVVLIISMLAAFVVPKMLQSLPEAKRKVAKAKMGIIEGAIGRFYFDCGRYPDDTEGLGALLKPPTELEEKWKGPYCKKSDIEDPWGTFYMYASEGERNPGSFDLVSLGADGKEGGEGDNEDIFND
jgi:general secretion pathway protein G